MSDCSVTVLGHSFSQSFLSIWNENSAKTVSLKAENGAFLRRLEVFSAEKCHFCAPKVPQSMSNCGTFEGKKSHT